MTSICAAPACSKRALIHEAERYQLPRLRYSHHETPEPGHRLSPRCTTCGSARRLAQRPYVLLAFIGAGALVATGPHLSAGRAALLATGRAAQYATDAALPSAHELCAARIRLRRVGLRRSPQRRSLVLESRTSVGSIPGLLGRRFLGRVLGRARLQ